MKVLVFAIGSFFQENLEELSDKQKYNLACEELSKGHENCMVFNSLKDFEDAHNNNFEYSRYISESWLYFVNIDEPKYSLEGVDGNAYKIMGYVAKCMGKEHCKADEFNEYYHEAQSGDYNHLVRVSVEMLNKLNERAKR